MTTHDQTHRVSPGSRQSSVAWMAMGKWMTLSLLAATMAISGCKKGDPGPAGANGADGTNGNNGINGKNGAAYDEAARRGSITTYLSGTTAAGDPFKDTLRFKFSSTDLSASSIYYYNNNDVSFRMDRFTSLDNYNIQNYTQYYLEVYNDGAGDTTWYIDQTVNATITTSDFKYFKINEDYYDGEGSNVENALYEGFKYDATTGRLYFRYSWLIPAGSNSTGHDLNVSGVIDVTVYESEQD